MDNTIKLSYLRIDQGLFSNEKANNTIKTNNRKFLKSLIEKIQNETYCLPFEIQETRQGFDSSFLKSSANGLKNLTVKYHGYGDNIISISLEYDFLCVVYNGHEVISQCINYICEKDIQTIVKAFKVLAYAKTTTDIRDSKMFVVLR